MAYGIKVEKKTIFGQTVHIRTLTGELGAQVIDLTQRVGNEPALIVELGSLMVAGCLCDDQGTLILPDPAEAIKQCALGFLTEFAVAALDVSGLGDDADAIAKKQSPVQ